MAWQRELEVSEVYEIFRNPAVVLKQTQFRHYFLIPPLSYTLDASVGDLVLAGQDATLAGGIRLLTAAAGTSQLAGQAVNLTYAPTNIIMADPGVFELGGQAATLIHMPVSIPGTGVGHSSFPPTPDVAKNLFLNANNKRTTLAAAVNPVTLNLVASGSIASWPTSGALTLDVIEEDRTDTSSEICYYDGISGQVITLTARARGNTTAKSFEIDDFIELRDTAEHHSILRDAVIALQTEVVALQEADEPLPPNVTLLGNPITETELDYLSGATDFIQTQLNAKLPALYTALPTVDLTAVGAQTAIFVAGTAITAGQVVRLNSSAKWVQTDADAASTSVGLIALALQTKSLDEAILVALGGSFVRVNAWNWTPGATIYLSVDVGGLSESQPSGSDDVIRVIGFAVSADVIWFNPSQDYITHI
jgi:hypothetical protein